MFLVTDKAVTGASWLLFVNYLQIAAKHTSLSVQMETLKPFGERRADVIMQRAPKWVLADVSPHLCKCLHFFGSSSLHLIWNRENPK